MVLVVVPNIPCEIVEGSVVRVGLLSLLEGVVLTDEVSSHWVESHS